jgi:hypothetical protein
MFFDLPQTSKGTGNLRLFSVSVPFSSMNGVNSRTDGKKLTDEKWEEQAPFFKALHW